MGLIWWTFGTVYAVVDLVAERVSKLLLGK